LEIQAETEPPEERISRKIFRKSPVDPEVDSIRRLVLREPGKALCEKSPRYRKAIADLKRNGSLLIAGVAGYVASKFGLAVGVVTALVAALLRLILQMGVAAFCVRLQQMFAR
jgi:hypothetical protein